MAIPKLIKESPNGLIKKMCSYHGIDRDMWFSLPPETRNAMARKFGQVRREGSVNLPQVPELAKRIPVVLYLKTQADADELIEAFKLAVPTAITRKL